MLTAACPAAFSDDQRMVGVKTGRLMTDLETLVKELSEAKVNTVFVSHRAFGSNNALIEHAHAAGIKVYAIFGVFIDAKVIRKDPSLSQINALGKPMTAKRKNYRLVCPNREDYRKSKIAIITSFLEQHPVDGLSLDFIRYGVEWEMIKPDEPPGLDQEFCFCPVCLAKFAKIRQIPKNDDVTKIAKHILEHERSAWTQFKCDAITSMVDDVRTAARKVKPDVKIAIHALPWTRDDYDDGPRRLGGQDFAAMAPLVDVFSPMCYHYMLYRTPESIHRQVVYMKNLGCRVVPCVQCGLIFRKDDGFTKDVFEKTIRQATRPPSNGVNLYTWRIFRSNPDLKPIWLREVNR